MSELEPERIQALPRGSLGSPYLYSTTCPSTQDVLRGGDFRHGAVAVAEHQTAGRGRSGRAWKDVASRSLLFSVVLKPPAGAALPQLSLVAGLAVAVALERESGASMLVKWPNDVLADGRKVAGILLEASGGTAVCGVGINVNQAEGELPPETRTPATSLALVANRQLDRGLVLAAVLAELSERYDRWLAGGLKSLARELEERNALRGRRVRIGERPGTAGRIACDGALSVTFDNGEVFRVESGEVELVVERGPARG